MLQQDLKQHSISALQRHDVASMVQDMMSKQVKGTAASQYGLRAVQKAQQTGCVNVTCPCYYLFQAALVICVVHKVGSAAQGKAVKSLLPFFKHGYPLCFVACSWSHTAAVMASVSVLLSPN